MKKSSSQIKLIYLPFLLISICFIVLYTFLNWLIVIETGLVFSINEDITKFWLPFILPIIPILIWLRPNLKLLQYKKNGDPFGLMMLALFAIAVPTIFAQEYLSDATAKLTKLNNTSEINKVEETKCYTIQHFYIDKQHIAVSNVSSVSGKHDEKFNMTIYVGMPVYNSERDTNTSTAFWIGKEYSKSISNSLSNDEKEKNFQQLIEDSQKEFDETDFNNFVYLERIGKKDNLSEYVGAIAKSSQGKDIKPNLFKEVNEPYENRTGESFQWIFIAFGIGSLIWLIITFVIRFDETKLQNFEAGNVEKGTSLKEVLSFLIPQKGFFITTILIELNVLIFIIMVCYGLGFISFKADDLLNWGGNFGPYTTNGQWWRLLTNIFLHGGLMHLVGNIYGLIFVGLFLEPCIGRMKFLIIYLVTGIIASAASIWWHPAIVSIGASGAIFGLYGFFLALLLLKALPPQLNKILLINAVIFVGYNLVMGLTGNIDNAAHIGGLLSGFILGLILSQNVKKSIKMKEISENDLFHYDTELHSDSNTF